jgi:hypothetical protein
MREVDDTALEARLRGVLKEHLGAQPLDLSVEALDRRRVAKEVARRRGRRRGITLLAAAALLLGGGALAAGSGILRSPSLVPPVPSPSFVAVATASPDETSPSPTDSAAPSASPIPTAGPGGVWIPTGAMGTPRSGHAAVRLLDGRVLAVSRDDYPRPPFSPATAELYDPASGVWSATGGMLKQQGGFPPTLLLDGKVLVGHVDEPAADVSTIGAEVYDPEDGTWSATGKMVRGAAVWGADFGSTATLLRDGKVLVAGQGGAQVYDPGSGSWSATGQMNTPRHSHAATLLRDGRVLAVGGVDGGDRALRSAELYDPGTGSWTAIANTNFDPPKSPGAPGWFGSGWSWLLEDGTLLFVRGSGQMENYAPATGLWTPVVEPADIGSRVELLPDGTLLMTELRVPNNADREPPPCRSATLFDPRTGSSETASSTLLCRHGSLTLLLDGTVLAAGSTDCNDDGACVSTGASEVYVPAGVALPPLPSFPDPPQPVFPSPTPRPTPLPPAAGPAPPNARPWKVTVENRGTKPAALFVAEEDEGGMLRLVGSATPNVVPAGATLKVTFLFPAKGQPDEGWIYVNPRPGEGGALVNAAQIGIPGKILIGAEGDGGWLSP